MKRLLILLAFIPLIVLTFQSCSTTVDNRFTFQNLAQADVYVNFRASLITVKAGETVEVKDMPKGLYSYETTYEVPAGTISSSAEGDVSGQVTVNAGTKLLIVYSSTYIVTSNTYLLSASLTSSDDETPDDGGNPVGP